MSYQTLYRKFRPAVFSDVKGQDHIVTTLKNQISAGRFSHAYLFCGTRGTGKTTVAKIFAHSVNCESPVDGSPCGHCPSCEAMANGTAINVIEMDAASNRGVDDIRRLIEEVSYPPVTGRYKVYIIDEVHMLTEPASNALLKTLEEPPGYVIFILATTDPQKLLTTILSRCQRYDFRRIDIATITDRLTEVVEKEGLSAERGALEFVAKSADGSMRDALSLLDQCIAFHFGDKLTRDMAIDVLGAVDTDCYEKMLSAILAKDITTVIASLDELVVLGRDLNFFVDDFTWYLRNMLLVRSAENIDDLIDLSSEALAALKKTAVEVSSDILVRYIHIFCELSNKIRHESQKRVLIEIELIRLCTPRMDVDVEALNQRMDEIESGIRNASFAVSETGERADRSAIAEKILENTAPQKKEYEPAVSDDLKKITNDWNMIKKGFVGKVATAVANSNIKTEDGNTLVIVKSVMGDTLTADEEKTVVSAICDHVRKSVNVKFVKEGEQSEGLKASKDLRDMSFPDFGMTVEEED